MSSLYQCQRCRGQTRGRWAGGRTVSRNSPGVAGRSLLCSCAHPQGQRSQWLLPATHNNASSFRQLWILPLDCVCWNKVHGQLLLVFRNNNLDVCTMYIFYIKIFYILIRMVMHSIFQTRFKVCVKKEWNCNTDLVNSKCFHTAPKNTDIRPV